MARPRRRAGRITPASRPVPALTLTPWRLVCVWRQVLYFLPRGHEESGHFIFMGRDKVENEDLIKYGLTEDIW